MRIPRAINQCVCFIGASYSESAFGHYVGTGFVLALPEPYMDHLMKIEFQCVVTARHVLYDKHNRRYPYTFIMFNGRDGNLKRYVIPAETWVEHELSDVAVLPTEAIEPHGLFTQVIYEPFFSRLEGGDLTPASAGLGADLLVTGLFLNHPGTERIIPIVRSGHIAAFPEPINIDYGPGRGDVPDLVLAEMHSLTGLSGSPVFVMEPEIKVDPPHGIAVRDFSPYRFGPYWLLGLMHGYYPTSDDPGGMPDDTNTGISPIVPTSSILELIRSRPFIQRRAESMVKNTNKGAPKPARASEPVESRMDERVKIDGDPEDVLRALLNTEPDDSR